MSSLSLPDKDGYWLIREVRNLPPETIPGQTIRLTRIVIGRVTQGTCLISGELDPMVTYMYSGGKVVRLHAACDTLWQRECATP